MDILKFYKECPAINTRRPLNDDDQGGYKESDRDFVINNIDAAVWLLEQAQHKIIMVERIHRMVNVTWCGIAPDVFDAYEDDEAIPRDEVAQIIADADHMFFNGGDKEAYEFWNNLPTYEEKINLIIDALPDDRYWK